MTKTSISIIMAAYKESSEAVQAAVENMFSQTCPPSEVIVVVDNPENLAVQELLVQWQAREARLRVVIHEQNKGLGAALNTAVAAASGEYVARMDVGDTSYPTRLEKQLAYMEAHPETDLLFTGWKESYEDGSVTEKIPTHEDFTNIQKNFFTKGLLLHASLLTKRELLIQHPYPEMDRPEDFVLFLELIQAGYTFDVVEAALYTYTVDRTERYAKIKAYSRNLLPHLVRNIPNYWSNVWFWLYFLRITGEYLVSRNQTIFRATHGLAAKAWKALAR